MISELKNPSNKNNILELLDKCEHGTLSYKDISDELWKNKEFVTILLHLYPQYYRFVSDEIKEDISIAKYVISKDSRQIVYVGEKLKDNEEFVEFIILWSLKNANYASKRLLSSDEYIYKLFLKNPKIKEEFILLIDDTLKSNIVFAEKIVKINPNTYKYFNINVRSYKPFIIKVLEKDGLLLKEMDETLLLDKDIVYAAIKNNCNAIEYTPLGMNKDVILFAIDNGFRDIFLKLPLSVIQNNEIMLSILAKMQELGELNDFFNNRIDRHMEIKMILENNYIFENLKQCYGLSDMDFSFNYSKMISKPFLMQDILSLLEKDVIINDIKKEKMIISKIKKF